LKNFTIGQQVLNLLTSKKRSPKTPDQIATILGILEIANLGPPDLHNSREEIGYRPLGIQHLSILLAVSRAGETNCKSHHPHTLPTPVANVYIPRKLIANI
jgi:hypothetical protein